MKKKLSLVTQAVLAGCLSSSVSACWNPLANGGGDEGKPVEPSIKDITYYTQLINSKVVEIVDCKRLIAEIKAEWENDKDPEISDEEYQTAIDQVTAEQYTYQAEINEYQYQILLLQKEDNQFTPSQIAAGIVIFTEKIRNLEQELKLKEKYPNDYPEEERAAIIEDIRVSKQILKMFEDLKEEQE